MKLVSALLVILAGSPAHASPILESSPPVILFVLSFAGKCGIELEASAYRKMRGVFDNASAADRQLAEETTAAELASAPGGSTNLCAEIRRNLAIEGIL